MKVEVRLNEADFFRFSVFNAFSRNQLWLRPAVFAAILSGCAGVCFALHDRRGAVLLGAVLLFVALGLPAAWLLSFFLSLRRQAQEQKLAAKSTSILWSFTTARPGFPWTTAGRTPSFSGSSCFTPTGDRTPFTSTSPRSGRF